LENFAIAAGATFEVFHARTIIEAALRAAIGVGAIRADAIFIEVADGVGFSVAPDTRGRALFDFEITIVAGAIFCVFAKRTRAVVGALARAGRAVRTIRTRTCFGIVAHVVAKAVGLIAIASGRLIAATAKPAGDRDRCIAGRSAVVAANEAKADQ
jgi:hypothetical protein